MHSEQKYIQYLLANDSRGIGEIYKRYANKVVRMVQYNSGSDDDGFDIFQESLMDIYHMAKDRDFQLTTAFEGFLLLVAKRKWLNALKKKSTREVTNADESVFNIEDDSESEYQQHLAQVEKENTVMELLETLGERCREIIKRCMASKNQEKIAESMGISYAYLRKKKSECMAKLGKMAKEHPLFKEQK